MTSYSADIGRYDYYQHNFKSRFLDGCFTYDWIIDGSSHDIDTFEMTFESLDDRPVCIKKAILIGKDGHQHPFKRLVNEPKKVVYQGTLPKDMRENSRVRYWRPDDGIRLFAKHREKPAETIKVTEYWSN